MAVILNLTWAIVLLPVIGIGVSFLAETPRRAAHIIIGLCGLAFAVSLVVLIFRITHGIAPYQNTQTFWDLQSTATGGAAGRVFPGDFPLLWGIRVDALSVTFMSMVLFLALVAMVHALSSVRGDAGFRRFFWAMALLTSGLLALVSSPNLFQFWLGWEVAGVAAWLLAAHHWHVAAGALAATRTFVLLRVADLALLLGIVMTYAKFGVSVSQQPAPTGQLTADPLSFSVLTPEWRLGHIGGVAGTGARTLVVLSVLFLVAAAIRAGLGPLHVWLTGTLAAPAAGVAMVMVAALLPAAVLVARVYPLLVEAPHLLTVVALVGAAGGVIGAVLALAQRDLFRVGMFAVTSQGGLVLAAFGMGGFSPALFMVFTGSCLCVVFFLAAGNLSRVYRTRDLADFGGAWQRAPRSTLALGAWAVGISGLSLNSYSALSATFRNALPVGGHLGAATQVLVSLAVLVTMVLTALFAFRVLFTVAAGGPARRRGFDIGRLRDADPLLRRAALVAMTGAAAAVVVGIPGVSSFTVGSRRIPGLTFSHFVFYGAFRQQLALDLGALAIAAVVGGGGALAAWWLFGPSPSSALSALRQRLARPGAALAGATPGERAATLVPGVLVRAGEVLSAIDLQLLEPIPDAMGAGVVLAADRMVRLRTSRMVISTAAALAVIAVLLAAAALAATGHFPVSTQ